MKLYILLFPAKKNLKLFKKSAVNQPYLRFQYCACFQGSKSKDFHIPVVYFLIFS